MPLRATGPTSTKGDTDFGSGGVVLLPTHYAVGIGKDGILYLADVNNMGHVGNFVQGFQAQSSGDTVGKSPVYWQGPSLQYLFVLHSTARPNPLNLPARTLSPRRWARRLSRRAIVAAGFHFRPMERPTAFCGKLATTAICGRMTRREFSEVAVERERGDVCEDDVPDDSEWEGVCGNQQQFGRMGTDQLPLHAKPPFQTRC